MSFWSGPPRPPPLETHFFEVLREGGGWGWGWGGVGGGSKNDPPFFGSKIMNLLVFFDFEPKKVFPGPDSMGFVWGGVGRALMQFMHFSAILLCSSTSVTPWYLL